MPASVYLDFVAPNEIPNLTKLHIYEAAAKDGPYSEIEVVTPVGTQGAYISSYTTNLATSVTDWFAVQWEDSKGALTALSDGVKGGTQSLVAEIVSRMLLRDSSLNEQIAVQEAEAAVSDYYSVVDPYTVDPSGVSAKILSGLTNLALARTYITKAITSSSKNKWVAGLVSLDTSSGSTVDANTVEALLKMANNDLGVNFSAILLIEEIEVAGGYTQQIVAADLSRSIIEVQ